MKPYKDAQKINLRYNSYKKLFKKYKRTALLIAASHAPVLPWGPMVEVRQVPVSEHQ